MPSNAYDILKQCLLSVEQFTTTEGRLNLPKIQMDGFNATEALINLLMNDETIKNQFFIKKNNTLIYNRDKFLDFISNKNFLANSYTKFSNKIGLAVDNRFFKQNSEVVLNFPFKDCVLEGGQSKDDKKQQELFFNETLAHDEIDKLLSPKVLTNAKRFDKNGHKKLDKFNRDKNGIIKDNLIIKGNNLIALHTLKTQFQGKVKLIYIDPPYNTGNDSFNYNDNFNHSTWLTFMKNRLEVARDLLSDDGVIFVQCDDNEQAYLKVLMDEVFGRGNNEITFYVQVRFGGKTLTLKNPYQKLIELVFVYSRGEFEPIRPTSKYTIEKFCWEFKELTKGTEIQLGNRKTTIFKKGEYELIKVSSSQSSLKETWATGTVATGNASGKFFDNFISKRLLEDGLNCLYKVEGIGEDGLGYRYFTGAKREGATKGKFYSGIPLKRIKEFKEGNAVKFNPILNFLDFKEEYGNSRTQGGIEFGAGKKPEQFLQKIIEISTKKGDIVLDYHLGSGTTCAVAHKMGRQYIGIEQMDYIEDIAVKRMQKVIGKTVKKDGELLENIDFDNGGISKSVGWMGGGEFVYCELKQNTAEIITKITNAKTTDELLTIKNNLSDRDYTFIDYRLNMEFLKDKESGEFKDFSELEFSEQQQILISIFDKNQLYVNYSERDDSLFNVSNDDKTISNNFYKK